MSKRQTGGRVKDVIGYWQKSAEVIVGRKRTATDASVKAAVSQKPEGLNVRITPVTTGGRRQ